MKDARKELLVQQFEEAALGLLMEEYADAEGKRLLQEFEAASAQGDLEPMPEALNAKCQQLIDRAYKKKRNHSLVRGIAKAVGKVAVVVLMLFGLASAAVLSVDAWRVPVLNFILANKGTFAFVDVGYNNPALKKQFKAIVKTVEDNAPSDYAFTKTPAVDGMALLIVMENSQGDKLTICVNQETSQIKVDTENAKITQLELNHNTAYLIEKDGPYIIWHDERKGLIISVAGRSLPPDSFWKLVYALEE